MTPTLPTDAQARKSVPIVAGVLDYFPNAIAEVARVSKQGNDQHNPGKPLHWARGKSTDHADCIARHLMDRGTTDIDGMRHSAKVAWRALALLEEELEAEGAPPGRASKFEKPYIPGSNGEWLNVRQDDDGNVVFSDSKALTPWSPHECSVPNCHRLVTDGPWPNCRVHD